MKDDRSTEAGAGMKIDMKIGWLYRDIVFGNGSERWILSPGEQKPYEDEYCAESQVHRPATTKKIFYFVADDEQQEQQPPDVPAAMRTVIAAMKDDPEYAWSWHCNVAMAFVDEGGDRYTANQAAARFMRALAGVEPAHELPALAAAPAPAPLTDGRVRDAYMSTNTRTHDQTFAAFRDGARFAERAHGIGASTGSKP